MEFHVQPSALTSAGRHAPRLAALPRDVAALGRVVQGLLLHEHAAPHYGVELSDERRSESHIRSMEQMLCLVLERDDRPLSVARAADRRLVGVCRHFAVWMVAALRAQGVPARARCGFATYFEPGCYDDHWLCEYRDRDARRWIRVDAQLDAVHRGFLDIDFDVLDVPPDRFLCAGEAWARCRAGDADPAQFGIFDLRGLWFVAGNLLRDLAALNSVELLAWDVWGAMPAANEPLDDERLALFDRIAAHTRADASGEALRALYESDERLRVPSRVFNVLRGRLEAI
jgi:hypothetical protein